MMIYIVGLGRLLRTRSSPPSWRIWSTRSWAPRCFLTFEFFVVHTPGWKQYNPVLHSPVTILPWIFRLRWLRRSSGTRQWRSPGWSRLLLGSRASCWRTRPVPKIGGAKLQGSMNHIFHCISFPRHQGRGFQRCWWGGVAGQENPEVARLQLLEIVMMCFQLSQSYILQKHFIHCKLIRNASSCPVRSSMKYMYICTSWASRTATPRMEKIGDLIFHCEKANKLTKKAQNRWVLVPRSHLVFSKFKFVYYWGRTDHFSKGNRSKMRKVLKFTNISSVGTIVFLNYCIWHSLHRWPRDSR